MLTIVSDKTFWILSLLGLTTFFVGALVMMFYEAAKDAWWHPFALAGGIALVLWWSWRAHGLHKKDWPRERPKKDPRFQEDPSDG